MDYSSNKRTPTMKINSFKMPFLPLLSYFLPSNRKSLQFDLFEIANKQDTALHMMSDCMLFEIDCMKQNVNKNEIRMNGTILVNIRTGCRMCEHNVCYAMLCYAMLCYAMLCYAMLCYAMLCYAMLCYAMLCYAIVCG